MSDGPRWAEGTFRGLLESAPDAMVIVDADGSIVLVNAQAERLFGYRREELWGERVEMLVPDRDQSRHAEHRTGYIADPRAQSMGAGLELCGRRKDGSEFPVEISLAPLETEDGTLVSSAIRDITDRRENEQVMSHLVAVVESSQWLLDADPKPPLTSTTAGSPSDCGERSDGSAEGSCAALRSH